jgi:F-type H+-transporting ATPase subunit a
MKTPLELPIVFSLGPVPITQPVVTTWGLMAALVLGAGLATRRLSVIASRRQAILELLVVTLEQQISETMGQPGRRYLPFLGTLFLFLVAANLSSLLPGVEAPTAFLATAAALALLVFLSVHFYGVRQHGIRRYLGRFMKPTPLMLPLNILAGITRTFSLMVRLFGNIMSGAFLMAIVLSLAGLFVPIPIMALELLTGIVQAYIFAVLATVFVGAAVGKEGEA